MYSKVTTTREAVSGFLQIGRNNKAETSVTMCSSIDEIIWYIVPGGNSGSDFFLKWFWVMKSCVENKFWSWDGCSYRKKPTIMCSAVYTDSRSLAEGVWIRHREPLESTLDCIYMVKYKEMSPSALIQCVRRKHFTLSSFSAGSHDIQVRELSEKVWYNRFTRILWVFSVRACQDIQDTRAWLQIRNYSFIMKISLVSKLSLEIDDILWPCKNMAVSSKHFVKMKRSKGLSLKRVM